MRSRPTSTLPGRRLVLAVTGVAAAACLGYVLVRHQGALSTADELASVGSLIVAVTVAFLSFRTSPQTARAAGADGEDETARRLAAQVRRQWLDEIGVRRLHHPRALRLRWTPSRPAAAGVAPPRPGRLDGGAPAARHLVALVRRTRPGQLVVLGPPGSGKSSLATLFTIAAIDLAEPGDPVPVLLALPAWDTRVPLDDWITRRIDDGYPGMAGALVAAGRVLPVLDGLDELPGPALAAAFDELNRVAAILPGLVVTCRVDEYEKAVAGEGPLSNAAVVRIEPVPPDDALAFLADSDVRGSTRWQPVADRLREDPGGELAGTLATPLMISLARSVYRSPATEPRRLLDMAGDAVDRHLLEEFARAAYPSPTPRRWLGLLARGTHLRWWTIAAMVHPVVIIAVVGGVVAALGAAAGAGVAALTGYRIGAATAYATVTGLAFGVLAGLRAARTSRGDEPSGAFAVITAALRDGLASGMIFAAGATIVLLTGGGITDGTNADGGTGGGDAGGWAGLSGPPGADPFGLLGPLVLLGVVGGTVFGIISNGLAAGRRIVPHRFGRRAGSLPRRIAEGCLTASPFAIAVAVVIAVLAGIERWRPERGLLEVLPFALAVAVATAVGGALVIGVPIGAGRWLSVPDGSEPDEATAATFRSSLRVERETLLVTTLGAGFAVGVVTAAAVGLFGGGVTGLGGGSTAAAAALAAGLAAVPVMVLAAFGSGAPWTAYTAARLWLAARGRLPWRLTHFLEGAHHRQILRRDGPAYQFRHERLRFHLSGDPPAASPTPRSHPSVVRRRTTTVTAVAGVVLLAVTGLTVVPDAVRTVGAKLAEASCRVSITVVASPEKADALARLVAVYNSSRSAVCNQVRLVAGARDPLAAPDPRQAQVWIPASSVAVDLLRRREPAALADPSAVDGLPRLTHDSLVLAVPETALPHLGSAGWPQIVDHLVEPGRWQADTGGRLGPLTVAVPDPTGSVAGLAALHGITGAVLGRSPTAADLAAPDTRHRVREVLAGATVTQEPSTALCEADAPHGVTVMITNAAVVRDADRGMWCPHRPRFRWAVVPLTDPGPSVDLPYVVMSSADAEQRRVATGFRDFLLRALGSADDHRLGYRLGPARAVWLAPATTEAVAGMWDSVRPPVTAILLVDASGSMGGARMAFMHAAMRAGMMRLTGDDRLGLWSFSGTAGAADPGYREHVPVGPAGEVRDRVSDALARLRPAGDTPLAAAVQGVRERIRRTMPSDRRVNLIVVTDDADSGGPLGVRAPAGAGGPGGPAVRTIFIGSPEEAEDLYVRSLWKSFSVPGDAAMWRADSAVETVEAFRRAFG
ncbi:VWA domain-containing protein [Actinoplanes sp. NEAU-A12]|uniref:VWA domain-containing protein n=1 Tax=Actinoplanes sandaracinus TaxID=3045177 RepID=A0ABT6WY98_9ACTN|nr:VWA domain-containing protein [Actinoplanes sandaracinus]MDI6104711.1 VWA domain-containing protein [Actinoplanes sandaracinus]